MRRSGVICVLMITLLLSGCAGAEGGNDPQERVLAIRGAYLAAGGCTCKLNITADYGQRVYTYCVDATVQGDETQLTVTAPQELAGVVARVSGQNSRLEYDGAIVETGELSADGLTPLSAVPALLESARSGFIENCTAERLGETETLRVLCRDPSAPLGQGREVTLWFDSESHNLVQGEIAQDGYRVILCQLEEFTLIEQ